MNSSGLPDKKKKHHHVWRHYLRAWCEQDVIWCMRKGKIFQTGLMVVAQEKHFYRLERLTSQETGLVRRMFVDKHYGHPMHPVLENWISLLEYPFSMSDKLRGVDGFDQIVDELLDVTRSNILEDIHANFETIGITQLDQLRRGDVDFFDNEEDALPFLTFLCFQYFRTKGQREEFLGAVADNQFCDLTNAAGLISILLSTILAHNLFVSKEYHLHLLENSTGTKFITGDQPVLNTYACDFSSRKPAEKLEFYYPVSPQRAMLLTEEPSPAGAVQLSIEQVEKFNSRVVSISCEQLYATSEAQLLRLASKAANVAIVEGTN
jgi:hypothetical protein